MRQKTQVRILTMLRDEVDSSTQIKVAIIDSGIDSSHPKVGPVERAIRIELGPGERRSYSDWGTDCSGHGTACAGIIRKKAPDALLHSVRIFDASLVAEGRVLIAAIEWCMDNEMDVVNMSLGTTEVASKEAMRDVCRKARDAGLILVAAESNDGRESYPASFPEVIGVTGGALYGPDGFRFRAGHPIECIARGDEQRVCWLGGADIMAGGNSFAAPHITGLVARILASHPGAPLEEIRAILEAMSQQSQSHAPESFSRPAKRCRAHAPDDYAWIKRAAVYPYSKEMHSLVRYRDLLSFEVVGVCDPVGKGMVGRDAGEVIGEPCANLKIHPSLRTAMAGADTLILGYVDQLSRIRKRDLLREYVGTALDEGCNVFSFQSLDSDRYADLFELARQKNLHLAFPTITPTEIFQALKGSLPPHSVDVPVLSILGTSSQQGKFTLQLALRRKFIQAGFRVGQLGTEHHARLLGMDAVFPMGYASPLRLPLQYYVPFLDYKMREICRNSHPDIILTGSQSGTVPFDVMAHSTHAMSSMAFHLGVKPDACILVVNSVDPESYIRDTIDGIRAICKAPTLLLAMGDQTKHLRQAHGRSLTIPQKMNPTEISEHLTRLEDTFQLPAVEILSEAGQYRIVDIVINHFSSNQADQISDPE
jgi:uncharacterized NAD-dependent epimerase/dehydratase family protein